MPTEELDPSTLGNTAVPARLRIEPLRPEHLLELAARLRRPEVYEHVGGVPSTDDFVLDRMRALEGPGSDVIHEHWYDFLVRDARSNAMLGRLEATLHGGLAEVAFLFAPEHWGHGYATEALSWLHNTLYVDHGAVDFWAATAAGNVRAQALLRRLGYQLVSSDLPALRSYDPGDLAFRLSLP